MLIMMSKLSDYESTIFEFLDKNTFILSLIFVYSDHTCYKNDQAMTGWQQSTVWSFVIPCWVRHKWKNGGFNEVH